MKCNYKRNQNNAIPRWALTMVGGEIKEVPISEEEYLKLHFEQFGIEIVTPKEKLINALKNGDYVIGVDYNPFILHDVFHYENGKFEFLKFRDISTQAVHPLKLRREQSILLPANNPSDFEAFLECIFRIEQCAMLVSKISSIPITVLKILTTSCWKHSSISSPMMVLHERQKQGIRP